MTVNSINTENTNALPIWVCAAGTGGHVFPGLAVANLLRAEGKKVEWIGTPMGMEHRLVTQHNFSIHTVDFKGLRGKGLISWLSLPFRMLRAINQARKLLHKYRPTLILCMGGYITVPVILANVVFHHAKLVIHEQNRLAGTANRAMARFANIVLCGFEGALPNSLVVGNPVAKGFFLAKPPHLRYQKRAAELRPLRIVVVGGSLGARGLNIAVPAALKLLSDKERTLHQNLSVLHQCGHGQEETTRAAYNIMQRNDKISWLVEPFVNDMPNILADADVVISRAGAQIVSEIAAIGVAALFVPFPFAIDDHQTHNAQYLANIGAATLIQQSALSAARLADFIDKLSRAELMKVAEKAQTKAMNNAAEETVNCINELLGEGLLDFGVRP